MWVYPKYKEGDTDIFRPIRQHMIEVRDLCKTYGDKTVIENLTCSFESGHVYSIIAPNGTGKTTFISILSGLLSPSSGKVLFSGKHSVKDTYIVLAGEKNLYAKNTVKENAQYIGRISGKTAKEIREKTNLLREKFPVYNEVFESLVERLSFGQKRLVSLLSSVVADSSCIIMDEVSEGLDISHVSMIFEMIEFLKKDRIIILASHDYDFIANVSDYSWFLKNGNFQEMFGRLSKDQLVATYKDLYTEKEI